MRDVPLGAAGRNLLREQSTWYESWIDHPDIDDPFWEQMRMDHALDRCSVPVLLLGGWQDVFVDQTLAQYRRLHARGVDVAMTIGPWTHEQMVTKAVGATAAETLQWLDAHLGAAQVPARPAPVRIYVTGRSRPGWVELADWPPVTEEQVFYLNPRGGLGIDAVGAGRRAGDLPLRPRRSHPDGGRAVADPPVRLPRRHRPGRPR